MTLRSILIRLNRLLRPVVDELRLNAIARPVWAALWRRGSADLVQAKQNDRLWWLHPEVALRGEYQEIETIRWLRAMVKPGMTVIDVGANVGQMTLEMAHLVGPSGKVIAIEPGPGNLDLLTRHVEANGYRDRVMIVSAACCDGAQKTVTLRIPEPQADMVGSGFQVKELGINLLDGERPTCEIGVRAVSLDGLMREEGIAPHLIKVDVEGAELAVFLGAEEMLLNCQPAIIFGFHPFAFVNAATAQREITAILTRAGLQLGDEAGGAWGLGEYTAMPKVKAPKL